jgi:methyl-accepting chemotaxis protein
MTLTLKTKLLGAFGAILVIFAASGLLSVRNLFEQRAVVHEIITNDLPMVMTLNECIQLMEDYRKHEKDVLLNIGLPDKQRGYYAKLVKTAEEMRQRLAALSKETAANEDLDAEVRTLPAVVLAAFDGYDKAVQHLASGLVEDAAGKLLTPQEANALLTRHKDKVHAAEDAFRKLREAGNAMFRDNQTQLAALARRTEIIVFASLIVGLVVGAALSLAVLMAISRPLVRVVDFAKAVATGNLEAKASGAYSGEMKELKDSIEGMVGTLKVKIREAEQKTAEAADEGRRAKQAADEANQARARAERAKAEGMMEAAGQLEKVVEVISSASEQLSAQVEESTRGTDQQSVRVAETATAMEEMNSTVLEVAKNSSQAAESSEDAKRQAQQGASIVNRLATYIGEINANAHQSVADMKVLTTQAEGIGQIMNVISDIADQTNLLALNAAIEAARAGDAGRGFAVVADEVRKLAEKTMTATKEVGEAIRGIQDGAKKNMANADRAVTAMEESAGLARQSGEALQQIVSLVDQASDQVRSIATASEEQSATSEEINRSVEEINRISSETADAMRQSAQAVGELAGQTQNLRGLIEQMKTGG